MVLELVHLMDVGISAKTLEGIRQERERKVYLDRKAHTSSSMGGGDLREVDFSQPYLTPYPRRRLQMFLSDGTTELQAIECEHLTNIELGTTPMGTKVCHAWIILVSFAPLHTNAPIDTSEGCGDHCRRRSPSKPERDGHWGFGFAVTKAASPPILRGARCSPGGR